MHMKTNTLLDHSTTQVLLRPSEQDHLQAEDYKHSWLAYPSLTSEGHPANPFAERSSTYLRLQDIPLLRIWDSYSGSVPESSSDNRMRARSRRAGLATREARKTSLALHADHSNHKVPTPYISFTSRPDAASDIANYRLSRRGDQHLVAIDPRQRLRQGLPILDMKQEMEVYGVKNPYRYDYFSDHYLCLWEVTPSEVIGVWQWDDLRKDNDWYENIVMPAFKAHGTTKQKATDTVAPDVDTVASILARISVGDSDARFEDPSDPRYEESSDSD